MATLHDGQPYLNINTFVYDELTHSIYMHTAGSGRLRTNVDADERVCFCVSAMGRLPPADTARELSVEYDSVMIFGRGTIVTDTELARAKMLMLIEKYFPHLRPGTDYRPITQQEIEEISVYRIAIESWSAKRKVAPMDFPGAFEFAAGSI
jgi:hypothetical protein